jgi:conjugative transfer signal peptidase TraF
MAMTKIERRLVVAGIICLPLAAVAFYAAGLRINNTASIPLGIYQMSYDAPRRGDLVMACPTDAPVFVDAQARGYIGSGPCGNGMSPLMKRLVAIKGDRVAFTADGVVVNGLRLKDSRPMESDPSGRAMPQVRSPTQTVPTGSVLLMGIDSPKSFDGRYYGLIPQNQITALIRPVLTW